MGTFSDMPQSSTTVRFDDELWEILTQEAATGGVSAAQYVRDAAILRLGYAAGARGDDRARSALDRRTSAPAARPDVRLSDPRRLEILRRSRLLDSGADPVFDRFTGIVRRVLAVPVSLVSLIDEDRHYFKSCLGLPESLAASREIPLEQSVCQHVVIARDVLAIGDTREDPRFRGNQAIPDLGVIAYLGAPLVVEGQVLGSLCAIDGRPRHWTTGDAELLRELAAAVSREIARS